MNLADLNPPQKEAALHGNGPLLILAGAGSGKTRVITYRIAQLLQSGVRPWEILAVTFTNKAAREMRERVLRLAGDRGREVWISTFHSFCANFLRRESEPVGLDRHFTIYDEDDQKKVLKDCLHELQINDKKWKPGYFANRISREKDRLMDAESFTIASIAKDEPNENLLAAVYSLYQKKLDQAHALDFGDLIMKTVGFLNDSTGLREKYQQRFQYILVDEYQDTNRAQYVLTKILSARHRNICVVGDDDQAIYSWRGADVRNLLDFEKDYPDAKVITLEQNYRSTQQILNAAWKLVQNNELRKEKKLWTERESKTPVSFQHLENEIEEAAWVIRTIEDLVETKGCALSQFAVFYRTNAQSRVLEDALRRHRYPYIVVGNVRFYERAEVKDILAYLKVVANQLDDLSLKRIVNCPPRGIGKTTLETMQKFAAERSVTLFHTLKDAELLASLPTRAREGSRELVKMLDFWIEKREQITAAALVREVFSRTKIVEMLKEEAKSDPESAERLDNVQELLNAVEEFEENSPDKSVTAYLEQVSLVTDIDAWNNRRASVTLMTVHIAKGLEFPVVFMTGLEEGMFPLGEAQFDQEDLEEERRLAYVGMTRAKDMLFLSAAASRRLFGQTHWNLPSRFVQEAGLSEKRVQSGYSQPPEKYPNRYKPYKDDSFEPTDYPHFRIGQRVHHPEFGEGKITQKSGAGDDSKVVVMFESGVWKKLMLKYAPLKKL